MRRKLILLTVLAAVIAMMVAFGSTPAMAQSDSDNPKKGRDNPKKDDGDKLPRGCESLLDASDRCARGLAGEDPDEDSGVGFGGDEGTVGEEIEDDWDDCGDDCGEVDIDDPNNQIDGRTPEDFIRDTAGPAYILRVDESDAELIEACRSDPNCNLIITSGINLPPKVYY